MNKLTHSNAASAAASEVDEKIFAAARESVMPVAGPQSARREGVPQGAIAKHRHVGRAVYPGVARDYWLYVPAQYDAGRAAPLLVVQDARLYLAERVNAPVVLDNMIAAGDLPPVIAVFVEPGDLPGEGENSRGNRSFEYDSLSDDYVRFLLDELLPEALQGLNVASNAAQRVICGMSSGGICAFNAAWERPDAFGRVITHCGSFTNIRGGHIYPSRVRGQAAKPIRVFLQSGAADLDNDFGNWPVANFDMATALALKGYDYRFEFGQGDHDLNHGGAVFPATLKWIWRPER